MGSLIAWPKEEAFWRQACRSWVESGSIRIWQLIMEMIDQDRQWYTSNSNNGQNQLCVRDLNKYRLRAKHDPKVFWVGSKLNQRKIHLSLRWHIRHGLMPRCIWSIHKTTEEERYCDQKQNLSNGKRKEKSWESKSTGQQMVLVLEVRSGIMKGTNEITYDHQIRVHLRSLLVILSGQKLTVFKQQ